MALSVNPSTKVISVPKTDLTLISGTLYEHDTNAFRLELKSYEDSSEGMVFERTHNHNTEITVAGITFARTFEIINGYSVEYTGGTYSVKLVGSNNNIFDVEGGILVQNTVQVIPTNSGGLITTTTGSGLDAGQDTKLTNINALTEIINTLVDELHKIQGLDISNPMTVTPTTRDADSISLIITGDGVTTSTVTRQ